jgi:hypothetical protein
MYNIIKLKYYQNLNFLMGTIALYGNLINIKFIEPKHG